MKSRQGALWHRKLEDPPIQHSQPVLMSTGLVRMVDAVQNAHVVCVAEKNPWNPCKMTGMFVIAQTSQDSIKY